MGNMGNVLKWPSSRWNLFSYSVFFNLEVIWFPTSLIILVYLKHLSVPWQIGVFQLQESEGWNVEMRERTIPFLDSNEQTNERTNQTNKQTNEQTNKQASKQTNKTQHNTTQHNTIQDNFQSNSIPHLSNSFDYQGWELDLAAVGGWTFVTGVQMNLFYKGTCHSEERGIFCEIFVKISTWSAWSQFVL